MRQKIQGSAPFQVLAANFSISPSQEGYTLQISADGENYSDLFAVGAGQTRMVTGVANGSYYRLSGNASEVIINWVPQCNDGGSGSGSTPYILPPATTTTLGGVKIGSGITVQQDGTISVSGGSANLDSVFPRMPYFNLDNGSQVVDYVKSAIFDTHSEGGEQYNCSSIWLMDTAFDRLDNNVSDWQEGQMSFTIDPEEMVAYVENVPAGNYIFAFYKEQAGDNYEDFPISYWSKEDGNWTEYMSETTREIWSEPDFEIDPYWQNKMDGHVVLSNNGEWFNWSFPQDVERLEIRIVDDGEGNESCEVDITYKEGGESVVYVSHLSDAAAVAAPEGTLIVLNNDSEHSIYIKVEGGEVASWNGYVSSSQDTPIEIIYDNYEDFVDFADGKVLFSFKYRYGSNSRYAVVDKDEEAIILYSDSALTTEITRASYLGNAVDFATADQGIRTISVHWKEDEITLRRTNGYIDTANLMDFSTEGVHYHRIQDPTKATAQDLGIANYDEGIPRWNNEGVIMGKRNDYNTKGVQFNYGSNSYSNKATVVVESGGSNIPDRVYVPIAGGSSGQILVSNGVDAAPTFQTLIKAQKITSAEYEALSVKDPNTLYLIDDES